MLAPFSSPLNLRYVHRFIDDCAFAIFKFHRLAVPEEGTLLRRRYLCRQETTSESLSFSNMYARENWFPRNARCRGGRKINFAQPRLLLTGYLSRLGRRIDISRYCVQIYARCVIGILNISPILPFGRAKMFLLRYRVEFLSRESSYSCFSRVSKCGPACVRACSQTGVKCVPSARSGRLVVIDRTRGPFRA